MSERVDVVVSGASIAGSTTATFFARAGLDVLVLERSSDPAHFKRPCTHYIQSSATPTFARLGVIDAIEAAGGVRNSAHSYSRYGWMRPAPTPGTWGYSLRREKLDPLLRRTAMEAGARVLPSTSVVDVVRTDGRVAGVVAEQDGQRRRIDATLVVGADGRSSAVAAAAGLRTWERRHDRFCYLGYFRGVPRTDDAVARLWLLEPDIAYEFPNDDDLTVLALMKPAAELEAFRADPECAFRAAFAALPERPDLEAAELVGRLQPMISHPNLWRQAARPGVALVGDAAASADYAWGTGCGFALQTAEWLADLTGAAVASGDPRDVDRALGRYRRMHRRRIGPHWMISADHARIRPFNPLERVLYRGAARDPATAEHLAAFGERRIGVGSLVAPRPLARAIRAAFR